jgi:hypothetical protein
MGKAATPALPALRGRKDDSVPAVVKSCEEAVASIDAAKDDPGAAERTAKATAVREEIARLVKARTERKEK